MREIRTSGSEGGEGQHPSRPLSRVCKPQAAHIERLCTISHKWSGPETWMLGTSPSMTVEGARLAAATKESGGDACRTNLQNLSN